MAIVETGTAPKVQLASTGYRISAGGECSAEFDFGEPAEWEAPGGDRYVAFVDVAGGGDGAGEIEADDVESRLEFWFYKCTPGEGEPEDIGDFDGEEGEEEEEEGGPDHETGEEEEEEEEEEDEEPG